MYHSPWKRWHSTPVSRSNRKRAQHDGGHYGRPWHSERERRASCTRWPPHVRGSRHSGSHLASRRHGPVPAVPVCQGQEVTGANEVVATASKAFSCGKESSCSFSRVFIIFPPLLITDNTGKARHLVESSTYFWNIQFFELRQNQRKWIEIIIANI